jgi:hypothetical protein
MVFSERRFWSARIGLSRDLADSLERLTKKELSDLRGV